MTTLVAGSYERFLFGLKCTSTLVDGDQGLSLAKDFEYPAHKGPIKCVATGGPFTATGGADDTIHLYNLHSQTDLGFLMSPGDGAVTALRFHTPAGSANPSHMLSGSADGSICIWRAGGDWGCLKQMEGHKRAVTGLTVHPSGRLALSTSFDGALRMWNLVKGKPQYKSKLACPADDVAFSPSGSAYALLCGQRLSVHSVEGSAPDVRLDHSRRQLCMAYASEQAIWTGAEDGTVLLWDTRAPTPALTLSGAHAARIRGVALLGNASLAGFETLVASAASDGTVRVWDGRMTGARDDVTPLAEAATSARLTCLGVVAPRRVGEAGRKLPRSGEAGGKLPRSGEATPGKLRTKKRERENAEMRDAGVTGKGKVTKSVAAVPEAKKPKRGPGDLNRKRRQLAVPEPANKAIAQNPRKAPPPGTGPGPSSVPNPAQGFVRDGVVDFTADVANAQAPAGGRKLKKKKKKDNRKDGSGGDRTGDLDMEYAMLDPEFASFEGLAGKGKSGERTQKPKKKARMG